MSNLNSTVRSLALIFWSTFAATSTSAFTITPVAVDASSTFYSYKSEHLIDDSGLSGGMHDDNYTNMWMNDTEGPRGSLTFDLGARYELTGALIWQYNSRNGSDRGVRDFTISISSDGLVFSMVQTAGLANLIGPWTPAQSVDFSGAAKYVKFDILTNWGSSLYTGLSEVKFTLVPEPTTYAMVSFGLLCVLCAARPKLARRD